MTRYRKYSTKFFCPECKARKKKMQMLYLDPDLNLLTCEVHPYYQRKCTCKMSDMIIFDMYPEEEEELERLLEEAPIVVHYAGENEENPLRLDKPQVEDF